MYDSGQYNSFWNATSCSATIDDVVRSFPTLVRAGDAIWSADEYNWSYFDTLMSAAGICPVNCLNTSSAVYGSFPYHGRSSACLAAIHAGLINNTAGGGFFISRFYRND